MIKKNTSLSKSWRTKQGSVLVFALIILSFILVSAFSLSSVALVERRSANSSVNSATAFQNSDKGMEEFLQEIYKELDQNDTLNQIGIDLNDLYNTTSYTCEDGGNSHAARIGDDSTAFIITSYSESTTPTGNWDVKEIDSCDAMLADVSRFRATGNHNNSARAVFLKLRDSLTRGLVAHWSFEDRAHIARVLPDESGKGNAGRISSIAQDYSKQGHTLTLCNLRTEIGEQEVNVDIYIDPTNVQHKKVSEFDECLATEDETVGMSPKRGYTNTSMEQKSDDEEVEDPGGAWVSGVVEEIASTASLFDDESNSEAIEFDGSNYLATFINASTCNVDVVNCIEDEDDKLDVDDGLAISMWINVQPGDVDSVLVSRRNDSGSGNGYELRLDGSGNICLDLDAESRCTNRSVDDGDWHHIVGSWRKTGPGDNLKLYIDGNDESNGSGSKSNDISNTMPMILFVGGEDHDEDDTITGQFTGIMDDLKIWNRALTETEICRICNTAEIGVDNTSCINPCP